MVSSLHELMIHNKPQRSTVVGRKDVLVNKICSSLGIATQIIQGLLIS